MLLLLGCGPSDVISPADVAGVLVRRSACQDLDLTPALASIVGDSDGSGTAGNAQVACQRTASSCDELLRCDHIDPATPCEPGASVARCEGDVLVSCSSAGFERRVDCASDEDGNTLCATNESGTSACGVGSCTDAGLSCDGDVVMSCVGGQLRRAEDCALAGRHCVVSMGSRAGCVDRVEACTDDACDGDLLTSCIAGMGMTITDCADAPGAETCVELGGAAHCGVEVAACTEGSVECAGDLARFCIGRRWVELDCASFDGSRCEDRSAADDPRLACVRG